MYLYVSYLYNTARFMTKPKPFLAEGDREGGGAD
jgi:hypothetical protein